jgi:hypothetical protein
VAVSYATPVILPSFTTYLLKPSRATVFVATWIRKRLPYHMHIVALSVIVRYTVYNRTRTPWEYHPTPFAIMKTYRSSGLWTQLPYLNIFEQLNSKKKQADLVVRSDCGVWISRLRTTPFACYGKCLLGRYRGLLLSCLYCRSTRAL